MVASLNRLFDISGWFIPLARRLLYAWVRTTVFPEQVATLGLDPDRPVCYVLQNRHLSNLLVLFEESRLAGLPPAEAPIRVGGLQSARSFFFLNRSRAVVSTGRERNKTEPGTDHGFRDTIAPPSPTGSKSP
jgi:glycerol-3-phosphate O-acyltransferase